MYGIPLYIPFILSLIIAIVNSAIFPHISLNAFAPFLPFVYHALPLRRSLLISCGCGLILDLLSSEFHFGIYALSFVMASLLLYPQKRHFFEDKPLAFSLFTATLSLSLTVFQLLLISIFDEGIPLSKRSLITDCLFLPLMDGVYSFLWFTCPIFIGRDLKKLQNKLFSNPYSYKR
ncbi:hypothetical protein [Rhabdochlamydiaceae symbiont of Dictyostelium giganteum]|uniref:hypothetical protein n=1 Tax=Rhabdochlamydiaceae symbiont of Dictyostelium giganteum TaxID=3342349 RepID=UPI003850B4C1